MSRLRRWWHWLKGRDGWRDRETGIVYEMPLRFVPWDVPTGRLVQMPGNPVVGWVQLQVDGIRCWLTIKRQERCERLSRHRWVWVRDYFDGEVTQRAFRCVRCGTEDSS